MGAHFTLDALVSQKDVQSMKVTSLPSVSARFEHIITMHKPEQATPHIIAKPIHVLLPPYAVNEKHKKHNMNHIMKIFQSMKIG